MIAKTANFVLVLTVILLMPVLAVSQSELQFKVEEFTLDNGMTFLVVQRQTAPVFAGYIQVAAGSAYERIGNIGSAHLFEHMMFKGSQDVGTTDFAAESMIMAKEDSVWSLIAQAKQQSRWIKLNQPDRYETHEAYIAELQAALDSLAGESSRYVIQNEFDEIYSRNGSAEFNAVTGYDVTSYFVSLPSNRLELWFNMEAGRLKNPVLREFFPERSVVSEERRQSVENQGGAKLFEQLCGTALIAHPYQLFWEWQSEVNNLTRSDLEDFFGTYYIPQRTVVAIVGDVQLNEVKRLAQEYFGDWPAVELPEPIHTAEPQQTGQRRVDVYFPANPEINIAWHKTAFDDPDEPAFAVIERLLGDGRTSRLYKSLVLEKQLCSDISVSTFPGSSFGSLYPGIFYVDAFPKEGVASADVEAAIFAEVAKLATEPVGERELTKIKNGIDAQFIWAAYSNIGLARYLAGAQILAKDWDYLSRYRENLLAVTGEDIQRVAGQYLIKEHSTVATLIKKEDGGES